MLVKTENTLRAASRVKSPSDGRLQIEPISSLTSMGALRPAERRRELPGSCQLRHTAVANSRAHPLWRRSRAAALSPLIALLIGLPGTDRLLRWQLAEKRDHPSLKDAEGSGD